MSDRVQHDPMCPFWGHEAGGWCIFCNLIWQARDDTIETITKQLREG